MRSSRPARSSSASTWARSTSSCRSSRPARSPAGSSASGGPATRSASRAAGRSSRSTAATCSRPRSSCAACTRGSSRRPASRATRSTCSRSRSSRCARSTSGRSTTCSRWCGGPRTSPTSPTTRSSRCSTCSPAATRPTSSPGCGPGSCGTASRAGCAAATARSGSRSPTAAPSPTAGCSACSSPRAPGSASSTRRWCTRAGRARRSCSVRRRGGSRRSPTTVSWSPPPRGSPARCRSGTATGPGGRSSSGARSARRCARSARSTPRPRSTRLHDDYALDERAAANLLAYLREQAAATGVLPDDRTIVVERFPDEIGDWRDLRPLAVRLAGARAVGPRARDAAWPGASSSTCRCSGATTASCCASPSRSTRFPSTSCCSIPTRSRSSSLERLPGHRAVRVPLPRGRGAGAAAPPPQPRPTHRALAAAPARRRPARRRGAPPVVPDPARDDTRVPPRRVRPARAARGARGPPRPHRAHGRRRHPSGVALRAVAAVRVDRRLHVRGRHAARRAAGRRARARPRPAARPPRRRRAARAARPGGDRRARARAAAPRPRRPARPRSRRAARPAPRPRRPHRRRDRAAPRAAPSEDPVVLGRGVARSAASDPAAGRRRGPGRRGRGRSAVPRCPRRRDPERPPRRLHRTGRRRRSTISSPATPAPTRRSSPARSPTALGITVDRVDDGPRPARRRRAASSGASSDPTASPREWCDVEVLRRLRRRSLARLRHEVEPVDAEVLGALPPRLAGHRRRPPRSRRARRDDRPAAGHAARRVVARDRRAARRESAATRPRSSTSSRRPASSCGSGAGGVGANDGRVVLCFRDRAALLLPEPDAEPPEGAVHDAIRTRLATSGASFWPELARGRGHRRSASRRSSPRSGTSCGPARSRTTPSPRCGPCSAGGPGGQPPAAGPRPGRLTRVGPPAGAGRGRWSRTCAHRPRRRPSAPTRSRSSSSSATACSPGRRRAAEGVPGGFAGVYPVLRALEEAGRVRRGYFVAGLGAAQFALPGAVDRLRAHRPTGPESTPRPGRRAAAVVLAATDPGPAVRRRAPVAGGRTRARAGPRVPPARSSCSSTVRPPRTSSGVAAASCGSRPAPSPATGSSR